MKRNSKALSALLAVTMAAVSSPLCAMAEEADINSVEVMSEVQEGESFTKGDYSYTETENGSITITDYSGSGGKADIASAFAGENVVAIGSEAFATGTWNAEHNLEGKNAVSSVILPDTVKSIGAAAFKGCEGLTQVTFEGDNPQLEVIGKEAFSECIGLTVITMPETLTSLGEKAFYSCSTLKEIVIPSKVAGIANQTFALCTNLRFVEVKGKDTVIDTYAFGEKDAYQWNDMKKEITFRGEKGSTTETFAKEKEVRFQCYSDEIAIKTYPAKTDYYYGEDLDTQDFTLEVKTAAGTELVNASDCIFSGYNKKEAGEQTVTVTYDKKTVTFQVNVFYNLDEAQVDEIEEQTYNAAALRPKVRVTGKETDSVLTKDKDYTVEYVGNHTDIGIATIRIVGKGKYRGTLETTYRIESKSLNIEEVSASVPNMVYDGKEQKPVPVIQYGTVQLDSKDYQIIKYEDNIEAGKGSMYVEGQGNYKDGFWLNFNIEPRDIEEYKIGDIPDQIYTRHEIMPTVPVIVNEYRNLKQNDDYVVHYTDNIGVGVAKVSVEGKGNYKGTLEKTFVIKPKNLKNVMSDDIEDQNYAGKAIEPEVEVYEEKYLVYLEKGKDYTVTYKNNVNAGTATVIIEGMGNYEGVIEKSFAIKPMRLADEWVQLDNVSDCIYTGKEQEIEFKLAHDNVVLTKGRDYTVTYKNNIDIGKATVKISGIGNYIGNVSREFTIEVKKGSTFTVGAYKYKIISAEQVAFAGLKNKNTKSVSVPANVKIGGKSFKVTSIANKALKGTAVKSVTIGKNVTAIGSSAFEKCTKLKKITIKTTTLKKVGKNALKGIHAKAKIKVPKSKVASYQKMMKKKGQKATVKITK